MDDNINTIVLSMAEDQIEEQLLLTNQQVKVIEHIVEHSFVDLQQSHEHKIKSSCHNNQENSQRLLSSLIADETRHHIIESHVSAFKFDDSLQQSCFYFSTQDTYDNGHFNCPLFLDEDPNSKLVCY
jgi:hypothetical protein